MKKSNVNKNKLIKGKVLKLINQLIKYKEFLRIINYGMFKFLKMKKFIKSHKFKTIEFLLIVLFLKKISFFIN